MLCLWCPSIWRPGAFSTTCSRASSKGGSGYGSTCSQPPWGRQGRRWISARGRLPSIFSASSFGTRLTSFWRKPASLVSVSGEGLKLEIRQLLDAMDKMIRMSVWTVSWRGDCLDSWVFWLYEWSDACGSLTLLLEQYFWTSVCLVVMSRFASIFF